MRATRRMISMVLAAGLLAATMGTGAMAASPAPALATPDGAVRAYLQGMADADVAAVLAASAVDQVAERVDFVAWVDRLGAWMPFQAPVPATHPMLVDLNLAQQQAQLLGQARMLVLGLLTDVDLSGSPVMADAAWAEALAASLDPTRLAGLEIGDIAFPDPAFATNERYLANAATQAAVYGADELTERIARVSLEGREWLVGFTLLRYGDEWRVFSQSSAIGGTPATGAPLPAGS